MWARLQMARPVHRIVSWCGVENRRACPEQGSRPGALSLRGVTTPRAYHGEGSRPDARYQPSVTKKSTGHGRDRVLTCGTSPASLRDVPARERDRGVACGTSPASRPDAPARDADRDLHAVRHTGVRVVQMHRCANRGPNIPVELTSGIGAILLTGMREKAFPIASCGTRAGS